MQGERGPGAQAKVRQLGSAGENLGKEQPEVCSAE